MGGFRAERPEEFKKTPNFGSVVETVAINTKDQIESPN
jgi:hypothetical protein